MKFFSLKRFLLLFSVLLLLTGATLWHANKTIIEAAKGKTFSDVNSIPTRKTALLLGTSKVLKNGRINLYFKYRIESAVELYKQGKFKYIIISGDNGRKIYDEPTDMKNELIKNGVDSNCIYLDYAGFRTFDSMVRVREIFGQNEILIISQKFHNERAIYIAQKLGIKAIAFNALDVSKRSGFKTMLRERFARVKVLVDFLIGAQPKFLGEKVVIR